VPGLCSNCAHHPLNIDGIRSVAVFGGTLRKAIHHYKYGHCRDMARPLGKMLAQFWQQVSFAVDVIVPVPLHSRRLRERGYNQSLLLAQELQQAADLPILSGVLYRTRNTVSQTHLDGEQRRQNVAGAFVCTEGVKDKTVLLVDDVCTTGATLEASSMALKTGGAKSVWALTLARAQ
jgi:ComF family protein